MGVLARPGQCPAPSTPNRKRNRLRASSPPPEHTQPSARVPPGGRDTLTIAIKRKPSTGKITPDRVRRAAGQSLPENPNRSTHSWESKRAPNYRRFSSNAVQKHLPVCVEL